MSLTDLAYLIQHAGKSIGGNYVLHDSAFPSDAEMLMVLAAAERSCPCACHERRGPLNTWLDSLGLHHSACDKDCTGAGTRYPTLREPCPCITADDASGVCSPCRQKGGHPIECNSCQGRGWVPTERDLTEKLSDLCYEVRFRGREAYVRPHENSADFGGDFGPRRTSLLSALVLATAAEEAKEI